MPFGTNKSSRIKICLGIIAASVALMIAPYVLSQSLNLEHLQYITFLAWVSLFFLVSAFAILIAHLIPIHASANATGKLFGFEMPIEIRGATVLLLGLYLLLALFFTATDLDEQLSAKSLLKEIEILKLENAKLSQIADNFKGIHEGNHMGDLMMLKLSFQCGPNNRTNQVTEWNRYNESRNISFPDTAKSIDGAFPVSKNEWEYRIKYGLSNYDESPIKVTTKLDENGILSAKFSIFSLEDFKRAFHFCKEGVPYIVPNGNMPSAKANSNGG